MINDSSKKSKMEFDNQQLLLKRIAFFMGTLLVLDTESVDVNEKTKYNKTPNDYSNRFSITPQRKKVGNSTLPNHKNRSKHYIGQPRKTGYNH